MITRMEGEKNKTHRQRRYHARIDKRCTPSPLRLTAKTREFPILCLLENGKPASGRMREKEKKNVTYNIRCY